MSEWDGDFATMPTLHRSHRQLVPDLSRIPEEMWREVLLPLSDEERRAATFTFTLGDRMHDAIALAESLPPRFVKSAARDMIAAGTPIPAPGASPAEPRTQVNFRVDSRTRARLLEAAEYLGQTPTALARMLVVNGLNRIFADQARLAVGRADDG